MCIFIVLIFSFFQCIAMQKSTEIHKQWLTPFIGYYQPIKWPTYVTDKIYFTSTKSLSGSHYIDDNSLTINETNISLNNKSPNKNIKKKNFFQNNYNSESLPVTIVKQDNSDIYIRINNENFIINTHYKTINQSSEQRIVSSEERIVSSEETILSRWIEPWRTYNSYLKRDENKIPLYSSRKPHVIFKDANGNLHTIQKETLTVPILGSILPISTLFTFLIRYHDVQLTSYNNQTGDHQVLKQNPFGWRNAIRTINVAFGAWFLLMLYSKFNQ